MLNLNKTNLALEIRDPTLNFFNYTKLLDLAILNWKGLMLGLLITLASIIFLLIFLLLLLALSIILLLQVNIDLLIIKSFIVFSKEIISIVI